MENDYLIEGLALPVHELDEDQQHMQIHLRAMQDGDPSGAVREHMFYHRVQMQKKMQMAMASMQQMQRPGVPGSPGGAGPGVAGTPRPDAQAGLPRPQGPPGMVHPDQMQGTQEPRR